MSHVRKKRKPEASGLWTLDIGHWTLDFFKLGGLGVLAVSFLVDRHNAAPECEADQFCLRVHIEFVHEV